MIPFVKLQSIGNDFVLVEADALADRDPSTVAISLCDRHTGIGADGLLTLSREAGQALRLRMFNPDGTEDFCGNGLRCSIHESRYRGWTPPVGVVHHFGREVAYEAQEDGMIRTVIGRAEVSPARVPLALDHSLLDAEIVAADRTFSGSAVSTGSTHLVILTDELPNDQELLAWGPALEHHPWFPARTSVMWARVEGLDRLALRIWERGLGETLGCGSGSVAAAAVWMRRRGAGGEVTVVNPGGTLIVEAQAWDAELAVCGTAQRTYTGLVALD